MLLLILVLLLAAAGGFLGDFLRLAGWLIVALIVLGAIAGFAGYLMIQRFKRRLE